VTSYSKQIWVGTVATTNGATAKTCDGATSQYYPLGNTKYVASDERVDVIRCDGSIVEGTTYTPRPPGWYIKYSPCWTGTSAVANCASTDVLLADFPVVTDDCQYVGLQVETPGGWSTTSYKSLVTDTGTESPCNQCIPAGTLPNDTYANFGLPQDGDPEGRIACYYKDVAGDPAMLADTYTPPASGGGGAGNIGAPVVQPNTDTTTTTEVISDGQGNSETLVTTTTTTTDGSGNSTTETTTQLSNCIDLNGDGVSDISGRKCGQSQTTSTTGVTTPAASQPVNPYGAFAGKTFADVWSAHSTAWMDTQVVGLINDMNITLNKSLPCYPFNLGSWGNAGQICLSDYAWIFDIIYYLNLMCAVFISRFIIFG